MDIITQLSAVGYLGKRLQLLGQEIQGLGYTLSSTDANMRSPTGLNMTPDDFHHLAGTAARLQAQIEHTLDEAKRLMFAAETASPRGASNR